MNISTFQPGDSFRCSGPGSFKKEILTVEEVHDDRLECRSNLPRFSQTLITFRQCFFDSWVGSIEVLPKEVFDRADRIIDNGIVGTVAVDWTSENKVAA